MPLDKALPRWIVASVSQHFEDRRQGIPMFIEGQIRDTKGLKDFFELRIDGPYYTELSKGFWRVYIEINVLIQSAQDKTDRYRIYKTAGVVAAAFEQIISIFKYGDEVGDDDSLVGCMKLLGDREARERIQISHFGQVESETGIFQSTVEAHYVAELRE